MAERNGNDGNNKGTDKKRLRRMMLENFWIQDIFSQSSTSTLVQRKSSKKKNKTPTNNNRPMGVLPTVGSSRYL